MLGRREGESISLTWLKRPVHKGLRPVMLGCEGKIEIRQKNVARSKQGACSKQTGRLLEASERGTGSGDSFQATAQWHILSINSSDSKH